METLTRWQDPTIDDLIKENLELKRKLGEADDAVEYWQIECDKRSKVLDKIKEMTKDLFETEYEGIYKNVEDNFCERFYLLEELNKLLEEIE